MAASNQTYIPDVLFWGGGTASSLDESEATAIMQALHDAFDLSTIREATIEYSPDGVDREKLAFFRSIGFNRMSSGVQSFVDARLRRIGRLHSADDARLVVTEALDVGYEGASIDIMCGLPDQEDTEVVFTMQEALKLPLTHLSVYAYRPTRGTALRRRVDAGGEDADTSGFLRSQQRQFAIARKLVADRGLDEYASGYFGAVSPFASQTFQLSADVAGFGSGAVSLVDQHFYLHQSGRLHDYIDDPLRFEVMEPASRERTMVQYLQIGLAMFDGVLRDEWETAVGVSLDDALQTESNASLIAFLRTRGLREDERGIRLDPRTAFRTLIELSFELAMAGAAEPPPVMNNQEADR